MKFYIRAKRQNVKYKYYCAKLSIVSGAWPIVASPHGCAVARFLLALVMSRACSSAAATRSRGLLPRRQDNEDKRLLCRARGPAPTGPHERSASLFAWRSRLLALLAASFVTWRSRLLALLAASFVTWRSQSLALLAASFVTWRSRSLALLAASFVTWPSRSLALLAASFVTWPSRSLALLAASD